MNKKEFFNVPDRLKDNEWYGFSWLEHITAVPAPLVLVTGYKNNGMANATMQSWLCFSNENEFYCIFSNVNKNTHMFEIAKNQKQLVINFPDKNCIDKCMATIQNNDYDKDELELSGLTYKNGAKVNAPVVDDCFLSLECEVVWEREIFEGSYHAVICVKIVNAWFDEEHYNTQKLGRYGDTGYLYNIHSPLNPETFEENNTKYGIIRVLDKEI